MKTAMQDLIETLEMLDKQGTQVNITGAIMLAKSSLSKEKDQLEAAHKRGVNESVYNQE